MYDVLRLAKRNARNGVYAVTNGREILCSLFAIASVMQRVQEICVRLPAK